MKKKFVRLRENTEKYIISTVPIEKEVRKIDKNEEDITNNLSYRLKILEAQDLRQAHYQILSISF